MKSGWNWLGAIPLPFAFKCVQQPIRSAVFQIRGWLSAKYERLSLAASLLEIGSGRTCDWKTYSVSEMFSKFYIVFTKVALTFFLLKCFTSALRIENGVLAVALLGAIVAES